MPIYKPFGQYNKYENEFYDKEYPIWKFYNDGQPAMTNAVQNPTEDEIDTYLSDNSYKDLGDMSELKKRISEVLSTLSPREERVLRMRFGIGLPDSYTLQEIALIFGVTSQRIQSIEAKALRKLKHPSRSRKLRDFMDMFDTIIKKDNVEVNKTEDIKDTSKLTQKDIEDIDISVLKKSYFQYDKYCKIFGYDPNDLENKILFLQNPFYMARNPADVWDENMDILFTDFINMLKEKYGVTNFWDQWGHGDEYYDSIKEKEKDEQ